MTLETYQGLTVLVGKYHYYETPQDLGAILEDADTLDEAQELEKKWRALYEVMGS